MRKANRYYQEIKDNGYDIEVRQDNNSHFNRVYLLKNKKRVVLDSGGYVYESFSNNRRPHITYEDMKYALSFSYRYTHKDYALSCLADYIKEN
jgi:hypothetical protein